MVEIAVPPTPLALADKPVVANPSPVTGKPDGSDIVPLEERVRLLGVTMCNNQVLVDAVHIAKPEFGGNQANVYQVLPQLFEPVPGQPDMVLPSLKLDKGHENKAIDEDELTAAMIVAARVASKEGIALKDVTLDQVLSYKDPVTHNLGLVTYYQELKHEVPTVCM